MGHNGRTPVKEKTVKGTAPELLAPVASFPAFHAAVESGADAVYCGLREFNARLRARNFTVKSLAFLVPYAHSRNVKVYVTLNTLIKQNELSRMITILYQLRHIGVDAVIVQDLGLVEIIRKHFSDLAIHASTQMVIHNSAGVRAAAELGFKRVILARELTLSEIEAIQKSSSVGLEVFVHGALCYSVSGLCLASSFIGGMSGNRGCCTQVCRRSFRHESAKGFYFSPKDLCALDFIGKCKQMGIQSFKIEGRMKSAEYVAAVVTAYRKALDNPEQIPRLKKCMQKDLGREKSTFFLTTTEPKDVIVPSRPSGTGIAVGTIRKVTLEYIDIVSQVHVADGDSIRIHGRDGFEGAGVKVIRTETTKTLRRLYIETTDTISEGDYVYLTSVRSADANKWNNKKITMRPARFHSRCLFAPRILNKYRNSRNVRNRNTKHSLSIRIDNLAWLSLMNSVKCTDIIFNSDLNDLIQLHDNITLRNAWQSKLVIALPPFIPQHDLSQWNRYIQKLCKLGIKRWMCSHYGFKTLFQESCTLYADYTAWSLNRAAQNLLLSTGFQKFTYSPEDDFLNIRATAVHQGAITVFGYVPLFISRIQPPLPLDATIEDARQEKFFLKKHYNLYYLLGSKPLCLFNRLDKLASIGIGSFIVDLRFCEADKKLFSTVYTHYNEKKKIADSTIFNFKAELS